MRNRPVWLAATFVLAVVLTGAAWYLVSPLFIDRTVQEAFPFELPDDAAMVDMSETEQEALRAEFEAAVPDKEELAGMSPSERQAVQDAVMAAAEGMPDEKSAEAMPAGSAPAVVATGAFMGADSFHQGSGQATLYRLEDGSTVLRLEDFMVTNGPDLHVLLATGAAPADRASLGEYIDLGQLKGNLGDQNYPLPADADPSAYRSVVVYCQPFHVVFATAPLAP